MVQDAESVVSFTTVQSVCLNINNNKKLILGWLVLIDAWSPLLSLWLQHPKFLVGPGNLHRTSFSHSLHLSSICCYQVGRKPVLYMWHSWHSLEQDIMQCRGASFHWKGHCLAVCHTSLKLQVLSVQITGRCRDIQLWKNHNNIFAMNMAFRDRVGVHGPGYHRRPGCPWSVLPPKTMLMSVANAV